MMEVFIRVVERTAFDERGELVQKVWIALFHKLRVYFHTTLELDVRREIFEGGSHTWRYVSSLLKTSEIQQRGNQLVSDGCVDSTRARIVVLIYAGCVVFDVSDNRTVRIIWLFFI